MGTSQNTPPPPPPPTAIPSEENGIVSWSAPVHPPHQRGKKWYLIGGSIVLICAAYGIIVGEWSVTVVVVLAGALYALLREHEPTLRRITLHPQGIIFEGTFVTWSEFDTFWIMQTPSHNTLTIKRKAKRLPPLTILLGELSPPAIRTILAQYLRETHDREESLLDIFIRLCKL